MATTVAQHPVIAYRETFGLSQEAMARQAGVGRLSIIRTEQCLFNDVPPKIAQYLKDQGWVDDDYELDRQYAAYRQTVRKRAPQKFKSFDCRGIQAPLRTWRLYSDLSQAGACTTLCVHLATWQKAEAGVTKSFPLQLVEAMSEAGYSQEFMSDLIEAHESWTGAHKNARV